MSIAVFALRRMPRIEILLDAAKKELNFYNVRKYLRFPTEIKGGEEFAHIVNIGIYPVVTGRGHFIHEGDSLCNRRDFEFGKIKPDQEPCPGCTAVAQTLAVLGTEAL